MPGLITQDGRAALAKAGGRAGADEVVGEVDQPPQAFYPAGGCRQVRFPGQEPGQGLLFGVGADRDAGRVAGIGAAAGPVGPVGDGPWILDAQQDAQRARVTRAGRKLDHSVPGNGHDDRRAPRRAGQVQGGGQSLDLRAVADPQLAGADFGAGWPAAGAAPGPPAWLPWPQGRRNSARP